MTEPWKLNDDEIDAAFARRSTDARERQIDQIVADTGMGRLQAHYHLQGRAAAIAADDRRRRAQARANVDRFRSIGEIVRPIVVDIAERAGIETELERKLRTGGGIITNQDYLDHDAAIAERVK